MRAVAIGILALIPSLSYAQAPAASSFSLFGVVEKVSPTALTTRDEGGAERTFRLSEKVLVLRNKAITLADIRPNDFVASAAIRAQDGKLHSTELRVFPEALRGLGEGQHPMNDARQQTMTNATVTGAAVVNGSNQIKVKFPGGESELILDPGVPVTRIEEVGLSQVQPGQKVRVQGSGETASRITIQ